MLKRLTIITNELKGHAPFTLFGALTGLVCMFLFKDLDQKTSYTIFYIFHPAHVMLSAIVTASMFELHTRKPKFIIVLLVGLVGSIGITTLSDSIIPYIGEALFSMNLNIHSPENTNFVERAHIGFIEAWQIVIPAAIIGSIIAYLRPRTKFPHAGHVLLSIWASSFHIIMAIGSQLSPLHLLVSFGFLFLAVWLPCCISDIIFPLLFTKAEINLSHTDH